MDYHHISHLFILISLIILCIWRWEEACLAGIPTNNTHNLKTKNTLITTILSHKERHSFNPLKLSIHYLIDYLKSKWRSVCNMGMLEHMKHKLTTLQKRITKLFKPLLFKAQWKYFLSALSLLKSKLIIAHLLPDPKLPTLWWGHEPPNQEYKGSCN